MAAMDYVIKLSTEGQLKVSGMVLADGSVHITNRIIPANGDYPVFAKEDLPAMQQAIERVEAMLRLPEI